MTYRWFICWYFDQYKLAGCWWCGRPSVGHGCDCRKDHSLRPSVGRGCDRRKDHRGIEDTEMLHIRDVVRESWVKIKLLATVLFIPSLIWSWDDRVMSEVGKWCMWWLPGSPSRISGAYSVIMLHASIVRFICSCQGHVVLAASCLCWCHVAMMISC